MITDLGNQLLTQITAIIKRARPLVAAIGRKDESLESQLRRSLSSIVLNVAEGVEVDAGNARLRLRTALGSLYESQAALRLAAAWGYVSEADAERSFKELEVFGGRLNRSIRRRWFGAAGARAVPVAPCLQLVLLSICSVRPPY